MHRLWQSPQLGVHDCSCSASACCPTWAACMIWRTWAGEQVDGSGCRAMHSLLDAPTAKSVSRRRLACFRQGGSKRAPLMRGQAASLGLLVRALGRLGGRAAWGRRRLSAASLVRVVHLIRLLLIVLRRNLALGAPFAYKITDTPSICCLSVHRASGKPRRAARALHSAAAGGAVSAGAAAPLAGLQPGGASEAKAAAPADCHTSRKIMHSPQRAAPSRISSLHGCTARMRRR